MRLSRYFLPILKETPKEAEIVSHRLMLRAGMIRQEAAGIYAWLPLGLRVLQKICAIVREEQNRAGAIEVLMPTIQSAELWRESRPLRRLRQGDAAHPRPARARHALRADQRGDDHRNLPRLRALLQGPAAEPLPHPVEVPRRGQAALRRHALARVPDEGRLFVRPRPGRRAPFLQPDVHRLSAHVQADGADRHSDARRNRPDRRRPQPRIHHPGRDRRERGVLPPRLSDVRDAAGGHRFRRRGDHAGGRSTNGRRSTPRPPRSTTPRPSRRLPEETRISARGIEVGHIFYFGTKYSAADESGGQRTGRQGACRAYGFLRHRPEPARGGADRGEPRRGRHHLAGSGRAVPRRPHQPEGRRRGLRRRLRARLRRARGRRASTCSTTTATSGRARNSPPWT